MTNTKEGANNRSLSLYQLSMFLDGFPYPLRLDANATTDTYLGQRRESHSLE